ncbi:formyltetrahydrofolate deformylase [Aliifodinibius sp. S!AR15-10]|uniref:formyltetrahydrofolate deformylase n=1 Tax=Aliifodinibius sp. S!AR15-10 TaxID=2950437 RepID=UPI0028633020|nr:formyltetrahydrofolate deformylase [Aliifodinibius sp. S!AR15-10]MDR8394327.1 formyltetrahydrofolate deformylase [Aliifodinibius sp. S!AR15-10]
MEQEVVLIDCPDEKGLVHKITGVLYDHGLNIISNQEFVDAATDHFFMRTAFEGTDNSGQIKQDLRDALPTSANIRLTHKGNRKVVMMATKEPHCMGDLLLRHKYGELSADIQAVISNHETLRSLAESFNIPFHYISHEGMSREKHEQEVSEIIEGYAPDYLVLAKYMRIFTPEFIENYTDRIVNIHHSFLPAFAGASPYRQAFERGVKIIGATAHFVTEDLDEGPIIAQDTIPVNHTHTAGEMAQAGRDVEKVVLAKALKLVLEERVFIHNNRTIVFE